VVSVKFVGCEDVYDLSVHKYHNFAANGVFIHNCFVFNVDDTLLDGQSSIVGTRAKAAGVAKAGGGVGYYFGHIRQKGSEVHSVHRKACGPVSVMKDYHSLRQLITQGGKRDLAQMGVLNCDHPDIREFIHCKDDDPKAIESFNISVSWKDAWLKKVVFKDTAPRPQDRLGKENEETKLWWEQCTSAWKTGDPGMFFHDAVNRANFNKHLGLIYAPNPCVTGDTQILTRKGFFRIDSLVGQKVEVWNGKEWSETTLNMTGENKRILRIKFSDGTKLDCTANHRFFLADGSKVTAEDLVIGDSLEKLGHGLPTETVCEDPCDDGYLAGFYCGDGYWSEEKRQQHITFYAEKVKIAKSLREQKLIEFIGQYDREHDRQRSKLR